MPYAIDATSPWKKKPTPPKPKVPAVKDEIAQLREEKKTLPKLTVPTAPPTPREEIAQLREEKKSLPKLTVPTTPTQSVGEEVKQLQQEKLSTPRVPTTRPRRTQRPTTPVQQQPPQPPQPPPQPPQPPPQPPKQPQAPPGYGPGEGVGGELPPGGDIGRRVQEYGQFVQSILGSGGPDTAALIASLQDQYMSQLAVLEQNITRMFQEQMGGLDPATQAALAQLRQTVEEQRRQLWEEMNRRGLLQSGIALEMADRLQRNQLTAEQQVIAGQFRSLQQQLNQALLGFAQQRLGAVREFGLAGIQAAERQALNAQDIRWKALQMGFSLAQAEQAAAQWERQFQTGTQQWQQQFQFQQQQAEREAERWLQQFQAQQQQWQQQLGLQRQQLALQEQRLYQPPAPDEQLKASAYQKLQAGATFEQLTEGEKVAIGWKPWQPATTGTNEAATNVAIAEITALSPVERQQLFQDAGRLQALAAQGVDIQKLRKVYEELPKPYFWQR